MNPFKTFFHNAAEHPLRTVLSIAAIAVGVGVLVLSLHLTAEVSRFADESFGADSHRVVIANADMGEDGSPEFNVAPQFDAGTPETLAAEYPELSHITPVNGVPLRSVMVDDRRYRLRSVVGADESYRSLMDLDLIAGSFFSAEDVSGRTRAAVLSESAAVGLFGSADAAIGASILSVGQTSRIQRFQSDGTNLSVQSAFNDPYTVVGVFANVPEARREAFGIADVVVPYTTAVPGNFNVPMGLLMRTLVAEVEGDSVAEARARIEEILYRYHGDDLILNVWEGSHLGANEYIASSRDSLSRFSTTLVVLGAVILIAATVGMFSMTMVDVLAKSREIGLRRALGATQGGIVRFFMGQSIITAVGGSVLGIVLAFVFHGALVDALGPFFLSLGLGTVEVGLPGVVPILIAGALACVTTLVFSLFPTVGAARVPIMESIREDAA